jgi:hypothetical protein
VGGNLRHPLKEELTMLIARPSIMQDALDLAPRLRKEDVEEVLAAGGKSALASLMEGVQLSDACFTCVDGDGRPVLMFGTVPHPTDQLVGCIWLLASDEIAKHRIRFLRECPRYVEGFQRKYPVLMNFTDCRNHLHHKWLRWCGFDFINIVKGFGPGDHPFYEVVRIRKDQCAT